MKALILAAGYATRLYPLTKEYPKALLKVGHRHIIDYIIDKLNNLKEVDEIIVITNSKFITHFRLWLKGLKIEKRLSLVDDLTKELASRRGAIGDMHFAISKKRIKDDLLVIGGDNLFDGNLSRFLAFVKRQKRSPSIGLYKLKEKQAGRKYGVVKLDQKNRVIDFEEKPKQPKSKLVAMCLYYFPKERLGLIKEYLSDKTHKHDATGSYIDWLRKKITVYGYIFNGKWYDIGDHKFYNQAKETFKQ